jgi:guanylate kinase
MPPKKGKLFVLIGPTSVGKNTLLDEMCVRFDDLVRMPSATERSKRENEVHGKDKFFLTKKEFDEEIKKDSFVEWQWIHGKRYGVLKKVIDSRINAGKDYIADIEVLGAIELKKIYGDNAILVFIVPPNILELERRIRLRDSESEEEVFTRLTRTKSELTYISKSDTVLINDNLNKAFDYLEKVIRYSRDNKKIKKNVSKFARALILDKDNKIVVTEEGKMPEAIIKKDEFAHEGLVNFLKESGINAILLSNKNIQPEINKKLNFAQPFWVKFEKKEFLEITFYFAFKLNDEKLKKDFGLVKFEDFLEKCDYINKEKFSKELKSFLS